MKIEFQIKLTAKDLFLFNIKSVYKGMQGVLSIVLPILIFAYAMATIGQVSIGTTIIYAGLGIMFLVYVPGSLWFRSKKIMSDPTSTISKPLQYVFDEEGIHVSVEDQNVDFQWENVYRMVTSGKDVVYLFTNRIHAYIMPIDQMDGQFEALKNLASQKLEKHRIKM